jgi:hypothetical protein
MLHHIRTLESILMGGHGTQVVLAMHSGPPRLGVVNALSKG